MVIDFHMHYSPSELMDLQGQQVAVKYEDGAPSFIFHARLGDLSQHIEAMDQGGIDLGVLSCGPAMMGSLEDCRIANDKIKEAVDTYPGRFAGLAHVPPLAGAPAYGELERAAKELGFRGVAIESSIRGVTLDSRDLWPFYEKVQELGLWIMIHPALKTIGVEYMQDYDMARNIGREFGLQMCTIRMINGGVFDDFPGLKVQMSHLGGGIAAIMGRVRSYQDKEFWGTAGHPQAGRLPRKSFDDYFYNNFYFDSGGVCGNISGLKAALLEMKPSQILFGTDYPQEIRNGRLIGGYLEQIRGLGLSEDDLNKIMSENGRRLLGV
ncbi:MAG: amidohydrolase [Chloroflexi bacterium]|nr:amidohydrolase [Chloroflexota bacterium]